jgi:hypothetical protein
LIIERPSFTTLALTEPPDKKGRVLQIILEDIQQRAKKLPARYRDPNDDIA